MAVNETLKKQSWLYPLLAFLLLVGAVLSGIARNLHDSLRFNPNGSPSFCSISDKLSCDAVIQSQWSELFGIPLGSYGFFFYLSLLLVLSLCACVDTKRRHYCTDILLSIFLLSVLVSLVLGLISHFLIKVLCPICLGLYAVNLFCFLFTWAAGWERPLFSRLGTGLTFLVKSPWLFFTALAQPGEVRSLALSLYVRLLMALVLTFLLPTFLLVFHLQKESAAPAPVSTQKSAETKAEKAAKALKKSIQNWPRTPEIPYGDVATGPLKDYTIGSKEAAVTIVEFADLECPHCRTLFLDLKPLVEKYGDKVLFVYKNFPLDQACNMAIDRKMHEYACLLAAYARCAGEQGVFWEAMEHIVSSPAIGKAESSSEVDGALIAISELLSLDDQAMTECMNSDRPSSALIRDVKQGLQLKVPGTPWVFINGKVVPRATIASIQQVLEELIG